MANLNNLINPIYLNEKEIKKMMELLYFSYREFTNGPDKILEKIQFGRAHHRIIYFIGKQREITSKDLLKILKITKQSFSRLLNQLVEQNYISVKEGRDKRTKNLSLTPKGNDFEKKLSSIQISKIRNILINSNQDDINGFKKILYSIMDSEGQKIFNELNK